MNAGPHIFRKIRTGKPCIWFVYAWRGGPQVYRQEGGKKPAAKGRIADLVAEARGAHRVTDAETFKGLVADYLASPEWLGLARDTHRTWRPWVDRASAEFGDSDLGAFDDRRMRGDILQWRDRWAHQPRSADLAIQVMSRLLGWAVDRGRLGINVAAGIRELYEYDRSDIIWTTAEFAAFAPHASDSVMDGVELAACTGLRRSDLVKLPWSAIGPNAIIWRTSKSRGRAVVTIPLLPETRALLDRIKARHAKTMAAKRPSYRKPLPETVLSNSRWRPWSPMGFGGQFNEAKQASGISVRLHDLRGTFATRCMIAGLTDQEIADILGWTVKEVARIRAKYVDQARVVVAIGERIARASVNEV